MVDLRGTYVVPPFGDAHLHALYGPDGLVAQDSILVARGVFYVLNPHVPVSDRESVRGLPVTVDVAYAVAGITAPGAHPATSYEARALGLQPWDVSGERGSEIRASRVREGDAYYLAATADELEAIWPSVLASGTDWVKVFLNHSDEWSAGRPDQPRGLSPAIATDIVRRAHAARLRAVAHVETAFDLDVALSAGVDLLAHAPGYALNDRDPAEAEGGAYVMDEDHLARLASAGIPITPTLARGPFMVRYIPEAYRPDTSTVDSVRAFHADLLRDLAESGVSIALGADSGGLWSWDEAAYALDIGGLTAANVLRSWSVTTPQAIFPDRAIGSLRPSYEASFLALSCDPEAEWSCTKEILHREKHGRALSLSPAR
ncbi:MAG: hypothetical protein HKN04_09815 [Rhodothermaceae bacterium]|nr:hypothetical protein [Rhodothermaceae bacterium]